MSRVGTWHRWAVALLLVAGGSGALGAPLAPEAVPAPLKDWVPWVLHGHEDRDCPRVQGAETRRCVWPSGLTLDLGSAGGTFEQVVETFAEAWVTLPGSARHWPQGAAADGAVAMADQHDPAHRIHGHAAEAVQAETRDEANVFLVVDGSTVFFKQEFTQLHSPGRVLKRYTYGGGTTTLLAGSDYQQLPLALVSGGKVVTLTRDHSFRLFAKRADSEGAPIVVTPRSSRPCRSS